MPLVNDWGLCTAQASRENRFGTYIVYIDHRHIHSIDDWVNDSIPLKLKSTNKQKLESLPEKCMHENWIIKKNYVIEFRSSIIFQFGTVILSINTYSSYKMYKKC